MIYLFGDSFAASPGGDSDNIDWLYYNQIENNLNEQVINFGRAGSGPDYTFKQFMKLCEEKKGLFNLNGDKFIFILSSPERIDFDFISEDNKSMGLQYLYSDNLPNTDKKIVDLFYSTLKTELELSNYKNLSFLYCLSEFFLPKSKFFVALTFGIDKSSMNLHEKDNNIFNVFNSKNFYYFEYPLDFLTINEFDDYREYHFDEPVTYKFVKGEKIYMRDDRINHFSKENHDILAKAISDFFDKGTITKLKFKSNFLDEYHESTKRVEYIYE